MAISSVASSAVTHNSATVAVTLDDNTATDDVYLRYGVGASPSAWTTVTAKAAVSGVASFNLTGLTASTLYTVQASLSSTYPGTVPAAQQTTFTTLGIASVASSAVTHNSATVTVTLADNTSTDTVYLRYRTGTNSWTTTSKAASSGIAAFNLTGLVSSSEYTAQASLSSTYPSTVPAPQQTTFTTASSECYTGTVTVGESSGYKGYWLNNMGSRSPTACTVNDKTATIHQIMWSQNENVLRVVFCVNTGTCSGGAHGVADDDFPSTVTASRDDGDPATLDMLTTGGPAAGANYGQGRGRDYPTNASDATAWNNIFNNNTNVSIVFNYITLSISTVASSLVTDTSARVTVTLSDSTATDTVYLRHRTGANSWTNSSVAAVSGVATFNLSGLTPGSLYSVEASLSSDYSSPSTTSFTTNATTISSIAATAIGNNTATVRVTLSNTAATDVVYFRYNTGGSSFTTSSAAATAGVATFSLSGLTPSTSYSIQASLSSDYSSPTTGTFTTTAPGISTVASSSITDQSVSITVTLSSNTATDTVYLRYGVGASPSSWDTVQSQDASSGSITFLIFGLAPSTQYTVQASLQSDYSIATTETFTTAAPTITSVVVDNVTQSSARVTVAMSNMLATNTVYLRYGVGSSPGSWSTVPSTTPVSGNAVFNLTGLASHTQYTVQASLASNYAGATSQSFTTSLPTISSVAAGSITHSTSTITVTLSSNTATNTVYMRYVAGDGPPSGPGTSVAAQAGVATFSLTGLSEFQKYTVHASLASNYTPHSDTSFTTRRNPPGDISGLTASSASSSEISVDWNDATNATGYVIQWSTTSGGFSTSSQATPTASAYTITGLTDNMTYYIRVRATRMGGTDGAWSTQVSAMTLIAAPGAISGLTATAASSTSINVDWDDNPNADGYVIEWGSTSGSLDNSATPSASAYTVTGLTANTEYHVRVRATRSGADDGAWSNEVSATTLLTAPGSISGLTVSAGSSASINVNWDDATNASGYTVQWQTSNTFNSPSQANVSGGTNSHHTIVGLTANTLYYVRVRATRSGGDNGAWSSTGSATTLLAAPGNISGLTAAPHSSTAIVLNWNTVSNATGYDIQWQTNGQLTDNSRVDGTAMNSNHIITGLAASTTYYIRVRATRSGGDNGAWSSGVSAKTRLGPPGNISGLALTRTADSITADWGNSIFATGYDIQWSTSSSFTSPGNASTSGPFSSQYTIDGLTENTLYYVRVRATRNGGDNGAWSGAVSTTTQFAAPGAITGLTASAASSTTINVDWDDTVNAEAYIVQWRTTTGTFGTTNQLKPSSSSETITGLTPSTAYHIQVRSTRMGATSGPWSSEVSATTLHPPPGAVSTPTVTAASSTSINVDWADTTNADGYDIQWRTTATRPTSFNNANAQDHSISGPTSSQYTIDGLTANTLYYVWVRATRNGGEDGEWSSGESATTLSPTVGTITVSGVGQDSATVTVAIENSDGTSRTVYLCYREGSSSGVFSGTWPGSPANSMSTAGNSVIFTLGSLADDRLYQVLASFSSNICDPDASSRKQFTTLPAPSVGRVASFNLAFESATLTAYISNGDGTNVTVNLRYRVAGTSDWTVHPSASTTGGFVSFDVTGLNNGATYEVQASLNALDTTSNAPPRTANTSFTLPMRPTPFPSPSAPEPELAITQSATPYLGTIWIVVGQTGSEYGYDDSTNPVTGKIVQGTDNVLPGMLFSDGVSRKISHIKRRSSAGDTWVTLLADFDGNTAAHQTGDDLRWVRIQARDNRNEVILQANLWDWDPADTCVEPQICANVLWEHGTANRRLTALVGQTVAIDFFNAKTEIETDAAGGTNTLVILAAHSGGSVTCDTIMDQNDDCYISGGYPHDMLKEPQGASWVGKITLASNKMTLETTDHNFFVYRGWENYAAHIIGPDDAQLVKIPLATSLSDPQPAGYELNKVIAFDFPDDASPTWSEHDGEVLAIQFEDDRFNKILARTPGGMVAGQIALTLFAGGMAAVKFRRTRSPGREIIYLGAACCGALILPIFGHGSMFWVGGVLVLCLFSILAAFFLRNRG